MTISAGPLIVLEVTLIAEPSAPVWKSVAVATPEILTSSSSVCPSTSKLPLASIFPAKVETPETFKSPLISVSPVTSIPDHWFQISWSCRSKVLQIHFRSP